MMITGNYAIDMFNSIQENKHIKQDLKDFSTGIQQLRFSPNVEDQKRFRIYSAFIKQALSDLEE